MRIALDATPLTLTTGGIRRYTEELSLALARGFPGDEFILLSDQEFRPIPGAPENLILAGSPRGVSRRRWWSAGLPLEIRRRGVGVFHGTDFATPYLPVCPTVMTVHDLSPWKEPGWHCGAGRVRARGPVLLGLGLATMVITPSEAVRREAIERFRLPPSRVAAIPLAASERFRPVSVSSFADPYFLYAGALEPRKNLAFLVEAWREVASRRKVALVLAGRRREDFPPPPDIRGLVMLGEVPEEKLPELYSGAVATLYPSFYEGFGLPVLEAMQCGCPVIVSEDPAIAEVTGNAALRLPHTDHRGWVEAMEAMYLDGAMRSQWVERATKRAQQFSWDRTARETYAVYEEAEARFGG